VSAVKTIRQGLRASLSERRQGEIYAALSALAWSTAGILQRQLTVSPATQIAGRGSFAFLALGLYVLAFQREQAMISIRRVTLLLAACMAIANASFMLSLNNTSVAHVLFFQALSPLVAALLGAKLVKERPSPATTIAMLVAVGGVIVMVGGPGGGSAIGDGLSLLTAVAFAIVIVASRRYEGVSTAMAICVSQLMIMIAFGPFSDLGHVSSSQIGWLALLGAGQVTLGTLFFALAARRVPAAEMALIFVLEIVLGPLWVWVGAGERPSEATLLGGGIVLIAVLLQIGTRRSSTQEPEVDLATVRR
jgi:drug/metabolite transporter (DMT)-like permease